jgi:hypothetical protein
MTDGCCLVRDGTEAAWFCEGGEEAVGTVEIGKFK